MSATKNREVTNEHRKFEERNIEGEGYHEVSPISD